MLFATLEFLDAYSAGFVVWSFGFRFGTEVIGAAGSGGSDICAFAPWFWKAVLTNNAAKRILAFTGLEYC